MFKIVLAVSCQAVVHFVFMYVHSKMELFVFVAREAYLLVVVSRVVVWRSYISQKQLMGKKKSALSYSGVVAQPCEFLLYCNVFHSEAPCLCQ